MSNASLNGSTGLDNKFCKLIVFFFSMYSKVHATLFFDSQLGSESMENALHTYPRILEERSAHLRQRSPTGNLKPTVFEIKITDLTHQGIVGLDLDPAMHPPIEVGADGETHRLADPTDPIVVAVITCPVEQLTTGLRMEPL
jgi:hypothetical protein